MIYSHTKIIHVLFSPNVLKLKTNLTKLLQICVMESWIDKKLNIGLEKSKSRIAG